MSDRPERTTVPKSTYDSLMASYAEMGDKRDELRRELEATNALLEDERKAATAWERLAGELEVEVTALRMERDQAEQDRAATIEARGIEMAELRAEVEQLRALRIEAEGHQREAERLMAEQIIVLSAENERLRTDVTELKIDLDEVDTLTRRTTELLTGVANALKGEPEPLHWHDWSDLPEVAAQVVRERDELRRVSDGE